MLEVRPPPAPGLPKLPRPLFLHAVLSTPVDRTGACRFLPCPRGLPRLTGGSASTTSLSRPAQASLTLRPARLLARLKADFYPEAPTWPVTRPSRSVATMSHRQLHGWILLPLAICAVGAHVESRKGAVPGPTGSRSFPFPAHQTGHARFEHPAFRQISPTSSRRCASGVELEGCTRPVSRTRLCPRTWYRLASALCGDASENASRAHRHSYRPLESPTTPSHNRSSSTIPAEVC
jgi:hypothetical protein